jgi:YggT family protein
LSRAFQPITPLADLIGERDPMARLLDFISLLITLYVYIIIAGAVMSWLIAFNVVNPYNQFVRSVWQGLNALTEPLLRPIRRFMPDLGGIDVSPVVLILACWFVQLVVIGNLREML